MPAEIYWLTLTALATALMWLPYILNRIMVRGLFPAMGNPSPADKAHDAWAERAMAAHRNACENLPIFGAVALAAVATGTANEMTATAAMIVFFSRIAHYFIYIAGIPVARTLAFAAGAVAQIVIALVVLGWI